MQNNEINTDETELYRKVYSNIKTAIIIVSIAVTLIVSASLCFSILTIRNDIINNVSKQIIADNNIHRQIEQNVYDKIQGENKQIIDNYVSNLLFLDRKLVEGNKKINDFIDRYNFYITSLNTDMNILKSKLNDKTK